MYFVLCLGEAAVFVVLLSLYRAATKADIVSFLSSNIGMVFLSSLAVAVCSFSWAVYAILKSTHHRRKQQVMALGLNVVMLSLLLGTLEAMSLAISKQTVIGETLLGVTLFPKNWSTFAEPRRKVIADFVSNSSHFIYDPLLGWTTGPSQGDRKGIYFSSTEG